ncbi:hypothetical protein AB7C87_01010 [Natrarchaeobius sp. A-rgal3]|uniref:hypothetical protein n=1 Tax=Natrarchaeobius versutus TaxID=1679078 RepID=UPI00350F5919
MPNEALTDSVNNRTLAAVIGTAVVVGAVAVGVYGFVTSYVLESAGALLVPTLAALALVILVVAGLIALGVGASLRLETPYW